MPQSLAYMLHYKNHHHKEQKPSNNIAPHNAHIFAIQAALTCSQETLDQSNEPLIPVPVPQSDHWKADQLDTALLNPFCGLLTTFTSILAAFWHISWILGTIFLITSFITSHILTWSKKSTTYPDPK